MSANANNVKVGAAVVSYSAYVSAGGAGSFTDFGYTAEGTKLGFKSTFFDVEAEQSRAAIKKIPLKTEATLKVFIMESMLASMRVVLGMPSGNLTGTPPDLTLLLGDASELYFQLKTVSVGVGTTGVRTILLWKCVPSLDGDIDFAKGAVQRMDTTFTALSDASVSGAGTVGTVVDA